MRRRYELIQWAQDADPNLAEVAGAVRLDQYYIPTRSPNSLPGGVPSRFYNDPEEAREAMELASAVLEMVAGKLPAD